MRSKFKWIYTLITVFVFQFSVVHGQGKAISGVVSDGVGPLPSVNIKVVGAKVGTTTDFDGAYKLVAKTGDVLEFSYLGYKTKNIKVGASSTINVMLEEDLIKANEVTLISSYESIAKEKVTGAISIVDSKVIENVPLGSFDQMLQGRAPGITVMGGSGQPGASSKVRIRGTSSINGANEPLYILDGVPITGGDFASLNSNDFENVAVLKDASATAIYGSRASAGVIVITSKKGKFNQEAQFSFRSQTGFTEIGNAKFEMMDSRQLLEFQRYVSSGEGAGLTDAQIDERAQVNTDWKDVFFRTGITRNNEISVRGGTDKVNYYNSISYFEQQGIARRSDLKRFGLRSNAGIKASESVDLGYNLTLNFSKQNRIDSENGVALQNPYAAAYLGSPYHSLYNEDGSIATGGGRVGANAFENLTRNINFRNQIKAIGNIYGSKRFAKYFTLRGDFGFDFTNNNIVRSSRPDTETGSNVAVGNRGSYGQSDSYRARFIANGRLVYDRTFNEVHDFSAGLYTEYIKSHFKSGGFTGYGINGDLFGYPGSITDGTGTTEQAGNGLSGATSGGVANSGLFSYFGIFRYGYKSKYNLDLSLRRDASNRFADGNKWGTFYSVGANWNITMEDFMEGSAFNNLKLRASYGTTGNQESLGDFQQFGTWGSLDYNGQTGIAESSYPNPELQWESGSKLNLGVDFGLWGDRLTGTVEVYSNLTNNLLISQTPPVESGVPSLDVNAGSMSNKGVDLQLRGVVFQNKDLNVSVFGSFNYNKNTIEDLGQVSEYESGTSIIREGLPFGSHYIVGWKGVNPANGQPLYSDGNGGVTTLFSDANSTADFGTYEAPYTGGFGTDITYKGFDLSAFFSFAADYSRFNNQTFFQENPNFSQYNLSTNMLNMWKNPGDITEVQSFQFNREFSSKDIEDASFLRLKNVQVGYTWGKEALKSIGFVDSVRVYGQAQNLLTWTKFTGFDPEDDNNIAQYEYPTPRILTFGLDVKF